MVKKIAVFCSGNGSNFEAITKAVARKSLKASIAFMFCDRPGARVLQRAHRAGIPAVLLPAKLFPSREAHEKAIVRILKNQKVDAVILAGYMRIFTPYFINAYKNRLLNIHPSLLPAFKGAHAIRDAFEAKVAVTGVTVHGVIHEIDAGPVLSQEKVKILKTDTLESLEKRIHAAEHKLYPKAIGAFLKKLKV